MTKQSPCIDMIKKQIPKFQFSGHCFPTLPSATVRCQCSNTFHNLFLWNKFIVYSTTPWVSKNQWACSVHMSKHTFLVGMEDEGLFHWDVCYLVFGSCPYITCDHHTIEFWVSSFSWRSWHVLTQFTSAPHSTGRAEVCWPSDAHTVFQNAPNWRTWYLQHIQNFFCFWGQVPSFGTSSYLFCFAMYVPSVWHLRQRLDYTLT